MVKPEGAAPAAPKPLVARVAVFDHDGVYWGLEERSIESIKAGDLVFGDPALTELLPTGAKWVDTDCDQPGGQYRWDGQSFVPLPRHQRKQAPQAPTLEQAFYDFLTNGLSGERVAAWVAWFRKTVDTRGRNG